MGFQRVPSYDKVDQLFVYTGLRQHFSQDDISKMEMPCLVDLDTMVTQPPLKDDPDFEIFEARLKSAIWDHYQRLKKCKGHDIKVCAYL